MDDLNAKETRAIIVGAVKTIENRVLEIEKIVHRIQGGLVVITSGLVALLIRVFFL